MQVVAKDHREEESTVSGIHRHKFMLWIGLGSMTMLFASLTSALIVKMNNDTANWIPFKLPTAFTYSTILIVLSSLSLHAGYIFFKKLKTLWYRLCLLLAVWFAFAFFASQYNGFMQLREIGIFLHGSASGGFVYVISLIHGAHIAIGLLCLMIYYMMALASSGKFAVALGAAFEKRKLQYELLLTFWHYIGLVWVYLYILFLTIYK